MNWFIYAFKHAFQFRGRARRAEFGWFTLINWLIQIALNIVLVIIAAGMAAAGSDEWAIDNAMLAGYGVTLLYNLAMLVPSLSVTVRRMHDLGWSGWNLVWLFVAPLVAALGFGVVLGSRAYDNQTAMDQFGIFVTVSLLLLGLLYLVVSLMLFFRPGQAHENRFGANPKAKPVTLKKQAENAE